MRDRRGGRPGPADRSAPCDHAMDIAAKRLARPGRPLDRPRRQVLWGWVACCPIPAAEPPVRRRTAEAVELALRFAAPEGSLLRLAWAGLRANAAEGARIAERARLRQDRAADAPRFGHDPTKTHIHYPLRTSARPRGPHTRGVARGPPCTSSVPLQRGAGPLDHGRRDRFGRHVWTKRSCGGYSFASGATVPHARGGVASSCRRRVATCRSQLFERLAKNSANGRLVAWRCMLGRAGAPPLR